MNYHGSNSKLKTQDSRFAKRLIPDLRPGEQVVLLQRQHPAVLFGSLLKPLLLPLTRPIQQAEKDLQKAKQDTAKVDAVQGSTLSRQDVAAILPNAHQAVQTIEFLEDVFERCLRRSGV